MNTQSNVGKRVRLTPEYASKVPQSTDNGKYTEGTVVKEGIRIWEVTLTGNGQLVMPYAPHHTDAQCTLIEDEKPATFYITSQHPEIMKVFWKEMKKVGYTAKCEHHADTNWTRIGANVADVHVKTKEDYMDIFLSSTNYTGKYGKVHYQLPQQWEAALKHITDAAKYWEEVEKKPVYKVGDWVVIMENQLGDPVGTVTQIVKIQEPEVTVKNMTTPGSLCTTWSASISKIRPATPQEIEEATRYKVGEWVYLKSHRPGSYYTSSIGTVKQIGSVDGDGILLDGGGKWYNEDIRRATAEEVAAAQTQYVNIGTRQLQVAISSGKIVAEGNFVNIDQVRTIVENMEAKRKIRDWGVVYTTCNVGCVTDVKLSELQEIVKVYDKLTKN